MALHPPTLAAGLAASAAGLVFLVLGKRFSRRLKTSLEQFRSRLGDSAGPEGGLLALLIRTLFPFLGILFLLLGAALVYRAAL
jgi:hypothetical protein